jgi:hypothetical protein
MDFIFGGKFFSTTKMFNAYAGLAAETAGLNELGKPKRDPAADGGVDHDHHPGHRAANHGSAAGAQVGMEKAATVV